MHVDAQASEIDCSGSLERIESMICSSQGLQALDKVLGNEYQKALKRTSQPSALSKGQREWLASTRQACMDPTCLVRAYDARISTLQAVRAETEIGQNKAASLSETSKRDIPPIPIPVAPPANPSVSRSLPQASLNEAQATPSPNLAPGGLQPAPRADSRVPASRPAAALQAPPKPPAPQHTPPSATSATPSHSNNPEPNSGGLFPAVIATVLLIAANVLTPRRDRRFRTGYRANATLPDGVKWCYLGAAVATLIALF
ncbi:Uncharacterized protein conserved in bacteria%2C putative lipoprotein [Bordetella ansorpii]|uniref:Uncharacterized protein conserved in bacteria, putative lipoprotein n=1 Tax=Bordetella ansorpii TaxID=288768 RepID=A0A157SGC5_9BORD|nr:Uncharacterized protein conserved in bacteria%2C putative lipoprotein [Bordetella ansorpii]